MNTTADQIRKGDVVTYCGLTFVAADVTYHEGSDLIKVEVTGQIPQYIAPFREVTVLRVNRGSAPKPYVVLTRDYDKDGNADKRGFRFTTRKQQEAYLRRTNRHVVYSN